MKYTLLLLAVFLATSCVDAKTIRDVPKELIAEIVEQEVFNKGTTPVTVTPKPGESKVDALKRERSEVIGKLAAVKASYDAQIEDARAEAIKIKCYWTAGIGFLLSIVFFVGAILLRNIPAIRSALGWAAIAFMGIALLALGVSWLVDYLKYIILAGVVLIFAVVVPNIGKLYAAFTAVTKGFDEVKQSVPGYKEVMKKYVDEELNDVVNSVRGVKK